MKWSLHYNQYHLLSIGINQHGQLRPHQHKNLSSCCVPAPKALETDNTESTLCCQPSYSGTPLTIDVHGLSGDLFIHSVLLPFLTVHMFLHIP